MLEQTTLFTPLAATPCAFSTDGGHSTNALTGLLLLAYLIALDRAW